MQHCESPYIVKYDSSYLYEKSLYMFVEYMNKGSLYQFIKKFKGKLSEPVIVYILR